MFEAQFIKGLHLGAYTFMGLKTFPARDRIYPIDRKQGWKSVLMAYVYLTHNVKALK